MRNDCPRCRRKACFWAWAVNGYTDCRGIGSHTSVTTFPLPALG